MMNGTGMLLVVPVAVCGRLVRVRSLKGMAVQFVMAMLVQQQQSGAESGAQEEVRNDQHQRHP